MSALLQPALRRDPAPAPGTHAQALQHWQTAEDIAAWAGRHFRFDAERALQFSSTRRREGPLPSVAEPANFFELPSGICLDLARLAVETLRHVDPPAQAHYLMVEFEPVEVDGHVLRLHWMAGYHRGGQLYVFADSERPGHIAGPYPDAQAFADEYAVFRGRPVLRHLQLESLQRPSPAAAAR